MFTAALNLIKPFAAFCFPILWRGLLLNMIHLIPACQTAEKRASYKFHPKRKPPFTVLIGLELLIKRLPTLNPIGADPCLNLSLVLSETCHALNPFIISLYFDY